LVTQSELLNTYFTSQSSNTVITDNYGIAPNGLQSSSRIQFGANDYCYRGLSLSTNSTSSVYVKGIIGETIQFGIGGNVAQGGIFTFNGSWQRIEYLYQGGSGSVLFSNLQGSATATDFEAFGLQVEDNVSYATSYIPTDGGTVTRVQDQYSKAGISNLINSPEGSFFIEMAALNQPPFSQISISLSGDSSNDRLLIFSGSGGGEWICQFRKDSLSYVQIQKSATITNQSKIAVSWKSGKYLMYIDGDKATNYQAGSETTSTTFEVDDLKNLQFSPNHNASSNLFYGKVKQLQVFKTALTPTELIALTT